MSLKSPLHFCHSKYIKSHWTKPDPGWCVIQPSQCNLEIVSLTNSQQKKKPDWGRMSKTTYRIYIVVFDSLPKLYFLYPAASTGPSTWSVPQNNLSHNLHLDTTCGTNWSTKERRNLKTEFLLIRLPKCIKSTYPFCRENLKWLSVGEFAGRRTSRNLSGGVGILSQENHKSLWCWVKVTCNWSLWQLVCRTW